MPPPPGCSRPSVNEAIVSQEPGAQLIAYTDPSSLVPTPSTLVPTASWDVYIILTRLVPAVKAPCPNSCPS